MPQLWKEISDAQMLFHIIKLLNSPSFLRDTCYECNSWHHLGLRFKNENAHTSAWRTGVTLTGLLLYLPDRSVSSCLGVWLQWGGENCRGWREYVAFRLLCVGVADWRWFFLLTTPTRLQQQRRVCHRTNVSVDCTERQYHTLNYTKVFWWWSEANWTEALWSNSLFCERYDYDYFGVGRHLVCMLKTPEGAGSGTILQGSERAHLSSSSASTMLKSDFPEGGGEQTSRKGPVTNPKHRTFMPWGHSANAVLSQGGQRVLAGFSSMIWLVKRFKLIFAVIVVSNSQQLLLFCLLLVTPDLGSALFKHFGLLSLQWKHSTFTIMLQLFFMYCCKYVFLKTSQIFLIKPGRRSQGMSCLSSTIEPTTFHMASSLNFSAYAHEWTASPRSDLLHSQQPWSVVTNSSLKCQQHMVQRITGLPH